MLRLLLVLLLQSNLNFQFFEQQKSHFKKQISYKNVLIGPTHMREMVK